MLLTPLLKVYSLFMVNFYYEHTGSYHKLLGFSIQCNNSKHMVYCKIENENNTDHLLLLIDRSPCPDGVQIVGW